MDRLQIYDIRHDDVILRSPGIHQYERGSYSARVGENHEPLPVMSEPIRAQHGVIDKYIGDAIMAYWGPPFNVARTRRSLPVLPPLDMIARVSPLCAGLPEILGLRQCTTAGYSYRHSDR